MNSVLVLKIMLVAATGVLAGFVNVLAGGGSLLTLPMLSFCGMDLGIANATNRISILFQNFSAISLYQKKGEIEWREIARYAVPAVIGAVAGTLTAIYISPKAFKLIAGISIALMGILLVAKPKMWDEPSGKPLGSVSGFFALFGVGLYGGFLQAGVGFLLIWALVGGCKLQLRRANIVKVIVVAFYTIASVLLFASHGMINWFFAFVLAAGTVTGGQLGASFNLKGDKKKLRLVVTAAVFISAAKIIFDAIR